jgi:hypothetical protein
MTDVVVVPDHPAKFPKRVLDRLREMLAVERERVGHLKVLDPFAGPGGIHELAEETVETYGVEIQPEWAAAHPSTICGSVLELPSIFPAGLFDVICTSPCYGNRMADSHVAAEVCSACGGTGIVGETYDTHRCEACDGTGKRDHHRNTYAHSLRAAGVEPVVSPDNAMVIQWGPAYRVLHTKAWAAGHHVLRPGGLVLLNVKNHIRSGVEQRVIEYHLNDWLVRGYTLEEARRIPTKGLPDGANAKTRTEAELVLALRRPR